MFRESYQQTYNISLGAYSIRINQQWRICFRWLENRVRDVSIEDYHR